MTSREDSIRRLTTLAEEVLPLIKDNYLSFDNWKKGETACILGHACQHHTFNKEGLTLLGLQTPKFKSLKCLDAKAGQVFFGLTEEEVVFLFAATSYAQPPTVQEAVDKVNRLIKVRQD
jgi:hypothetical protein